MNLFNRISTAAKFFKSLGSTGIDTLDPLAHLYPNTSKFRSYKDYVDASQRIGLVARCCSIIGENMASIGWNIVDQNKEQIKDQDVLNLFSKPNSYQTGFEFIESIVWYLLLSGNCYIYLNKGDAYSSLKRRPSELFCLNPTRITIVPSTNGVTMVDKYQYRQRTGTLYEFSPEDVVHIKLPNPNSDLYGLGKIQQDPILYDLVYAAKKVNYNFFENGAKPSGILKSDKKLDDVTATKIMSRWNMQHTSVDKFGKTALLTDGLDYQSTMLTQHDMAYIEQMKMSREDILSMFGVPPAKAGFTESASLNNATQQDLDFKRDTINPMRIRISSAFNKIVDLFDVRYEFLFDEVVVKDLESLNKRLIEQVNSGLITRNEARIALGLEPVDDSMMDQVFIAMNYVPIGDASLEESTVNSPANENPESESEDDSEDMAEEKGIKTTRSQVAMHRQATRSKNRIEKKLKKAMLSYFQEEKRLILDSVGKSNFYEHVKAAKKPIEKYAEPSHMAAIAVGIGDAASFTGIEDAPEATMKNPMVKKAIDKMSRLISKVDDTTKKRISEIVDRGIADGKTLREIKTDIENDDAGLFGPYRASMIARTQTGAAWDSGALLTYKDAGIKFIDIIGCEDDIPDCNAQNVPIEDADSLEFHPNHTGAMVPRIG